MLTLPNQFDINECVIILLALGNIVIFLLPKRFPTSITVLLVLLSITTAKILDHTIAISPFELYDINDSPKYEIFDFLLYACYPPFGYLCAYFYSKLNLKGGFELLYIIGWAFFAVLFEWLLASIGIFNYKGWSIYYSFPTYLIVIFVYLIFYKFIHRYYHKTMMD